MNIIKDTCCRNGAILGKLWWMQFVALAALGLAGAAQSNQGLENAAKSGMRAPGISYPHQVLAQSATGSARSAQADLDALVKAAKAEGELTYYSNITDNIGARISQQFKAKYGITAVYARFIGDAGLQRFGNEAEVGTFAADALLNFGSATSKFAEEGIRKGWIESVSAAGLPVLRSGEFPSRLIRGPLALVQIAPWLIVYNTDKLKGADVPKDWTDLLNPK